MMEGFHPFYRNMQWFKVPILFKKTRYCFTLEIMVLWGNKYGFYYIIRIQEEEEGK